MESENFEHMASVTQKRKRAYLTETEKCLMIKM